MSDMEHNKGRLIPTGIDLELYDEDAIEELYENDIVIIDGEAYKVEWEIECGELYDFAYVDQHEDGSISFNTWHYNGAAHWTEIVENALNEKD